MYSHILVPTDGTELSTETIGSAVEFARDAGARITFFHAVPDYLATGDGALMHAVAPEIAAEKAAGDAHAILSKAEAAARSAAVPCAILCKISDRPHEAILDAAEEQGCDLIFTAARGPRSIGGLMLGSETLKVLMHARIPVLVASVLRNAPVPGMNKAVAIIQDEHRSLAVVLHGLKYLLDEIRAGGSSPDFRLLNAMVHYIRAFPETLHHPKEDAYLFAALRKRTRDADTIIAELEQHHVDGAHLLKTLENTLKHFETGGADGFELFVRAVDEFAQAQWDHMSLEEKVLIPMAKEHLLAEDWTAIADAFGKNGDPRFGAEPDKAFRNLFSRIVRITVPEIGGAGASLPPGSRT